MNKGLQFGVIFRFREREYIYLAGTDELMYAALILDMSMSRQVQAIATKREIQNKTIALKNVLYCFVVLETKEYSGQVATLAKTDDVTYESLTSAQVIATQLIAQDLQKLKEEVMTGNVPLGLKALVKDIDTA